MGKEFKVVKENKKSTRYENDDYEVLLKTPSRKFVDRYNDPDKTYWYDSDREDGELFTAEIQEITVKSKKTGKSSTKRVYQNDPIGDLEADLDKKVQFKDMFDKID